jgi:hypothetical protein
LITNQNVGKKERETAPDTTCCDAKCRAYPEAVGSLQFAKNNTATGAKLVLLLTSGMLLSIFRSRPSARPSSNLLIYIASHGEQ